ncbi:chromosome segregation protein SMC [Legionella massiliensis]|uniref:Chromosome segregation protein SMC n=1 Tax=Legionella massiliensis TaxID=1034943 RepID=A0A078KUT4_9GAMM|nr:hypothetical protein [Legionella massiliensis]CDZ78215.1 chromosome segregation protein SMC [Legionella massiliensis]CEE13953.1 hypothetical protein BN1094_02523 [Legionella massiliensis]
MSKPNDLADIFFLLNQEVVQEKNHFLFFLGTDTVFTQRPTITLEDPVQKKSYEQGETLSLAAQTVVAYLGEQGQAEIGKLGEPLSYNSPSVDVLNGPTTLGTEVGKRVAQGVFLALRAAASGKENLEIASHSRGSVEAIMVMNELARIKKALAEHPKKSLRDILCEAPGDDDNTYIAAAMRELFQIPDNEKPELRVELLHRLNKLKINPFLMDPVPGGSKFGIKKIRWHSPRFYEKPTCDNYELILFRDERTCCFTPIVPEGMQPLVLPGHHGSASGNRYNQQGVEVPQDIENRDTTTIQNLVLCKLFYFFNQNTGGRFDQAFYQKLDSGHEKLDSVLNNFLSADDITRREIILNHYMEVQKNDEAYRSFANGSYAWLGAQYTASKQRFVHLRGHNHSSMENVAPTFNETFLNEEHALLYLRKYIDFDELTESTLDQIVSKTTITLGKTIQALLSPLEVNEDKDVQKLLDLLQSENGAKIFFNSLSLLVDIISQKYLRNNLTQEEDINLRNVIEEPFRILKAAKERIKSDGNIHVSHKEYIKQFDDLIETGLKNTVETHFHSIIEQTDYLYVQISYLLTPPESYYKILQDFISSHLSKDERLAAVAASLGEVSADRVRSISDIQEIITGTVGSFGENLSVELKEIISSKANEFLQPCIEAHQTSVEDYLKNIERLYNLSATLSKDLPALRNLLSEKKIEIERMDLDYRMSYLVKIGGCLLKEKAFDLRTKPEYLSGSFFELLKREAIKHGAHSPEIEDLQTSNQSLSTCLRQQEQKFGEQSIVLAKVDEELRNRERHLEEQNSIVTSLIAEQQKKDRIIEEQSTKLNSLSADLKSGEATIEEQGSRLDSLSIELESRDKTIKEQGATVKSLTEDLESRDATIKEQSSKLNTLSTNLKSREATIEEQGSRLDLLTSDLQSRDKTISEQGSRLDSLSIELESRDRAIKEQGAKVKSLTEDLENRDRTIKEQSSKLEALSTNLENREATIEEQGSQLGLLSKELERRNATIADQKNRLASTTEELEAKNRIIDEQARKLQGLGKTSEEEKSNHDLRLLQKQRLIDQLNSAKEREQAVLITAKLLPFTIEYQNELLDSAKQYSPDLEQIEYGTLPNMKEDPENPAKKVEYDKIAAKFAIVSNLRHLLEDSKSEPLPSARVSNFQATLHDADVELNLKAHRDEGWGRFAKACFTALAITITGVFPGVLGLIAVSYYADKSFPTFFKLHSRGENYLRKCDAALPPFDTAEELVQTESSEGLSVSSA